MGECSFWYWPTRVVPDQRPLNGRCCCCCIYMVSNGCLSLYLNIAGLQQGPGKMLLGSRRVLGFFYSQESGKPVTCVFFRVCVCVHVCICMPG